ncbi:family 10 glycosylhydrolase [Proteiniphilum sp.]|uniref:glycoside hydrolase family 10 protein n=1 Tax=Proteiniphilum sp. TaxID=1926877 RepID=UPI00332CF28E
MRKKIYYYIIFLLSAYVISCSDDGPGSDGNPDGPNPIPTDELVFPKKEMRAVWITTAWGLDWPMTQYGVEAQKNQYIQYLDKFKELNINTVIFQVKPMGDAFYNSPYEPWSLSITGIRGKDPGYDVLQFLIEETHKRDMEFHAWMNPYRIATRANNGTAYPTLHASVKPEWVVSHEKIQIYNPALPEVRQRLADIVKDLITKYDVDGIHFDDYFYPDPSSAGAMVSDVSDYQKYGTAYSSIEDFRRANVDIAIKDVHGVIATNKPEIVFTVSPAADPKYSLNTLFADVAKWCKEGWIDVVMPQLYQEIGNSSNDFQERLNWWTQYNHTAVPMIGHALYKFGDGTSPSAFQSTLELQRQFDLSRRNKKVMGNAMYSGRFILSNPIGITNKLAEIYKTPAVIPFLGREVAPAPTKPQNVKIENGQLTWNKQGNVRSVIYHFPDIKKEGIVLSITDQTSFPITAKGYYCVTNINTDNKESDPSEIVKNGI